MVVHLAPEVVLVGCQYSAARSMLMRASDSMIATSAQVAQRRGSVAWYVRNRCARCAWSSPPFADGLGFGADAPLANETMRDQWTGWLAMRASRLVQPGGFAWQLSIQKRG